MQEDNTVKKKLFVTADIHGHATELKDALKKAGFDKKQQPYSKTLRFWNRVVSFHSIVLIKNLTALAVNSHTFVKADLANGESLLLRYAISVASLSPYQGVLPAQTSS